MSMIKSNRFARMSNTDIFIDVINHFLLLIALVLAAYPIYFIIIASFSDPDSVNLGKTWLLPANFSLGGYKRVINDPQVLKGYMNSAVYTVVGTIVNLAITLTGAYSLSRKDFKPRRYIMFLITFTMFFSGGMIPSFLVVKELHLLNKIWALVLPHAVSTMNLLITRTFYSMTIPDELLEAAKIDGCNNFTFFRMIVLPLSTTIIAILALFHGVAHWNSYFSALLYIFDMEKYPIQLILRNILILNEVQSSMVDASSEGRDEWYRIGEMIKYSIIVFSCLPIMILYPFIQKYFVKGLMLGAIKG